MFTQPNKEGIMKKHSVFSICLLLMVMACLLVFAPASHAAKTLKIGIVDCYSGPPSTYTNDVRDAFKMEAEKINAAGGILGRQVEVLTRDSKFKVDIGLSAAKELIYRENVDVIMGTINSALALAISDMCKKEKVPFLRPFPRAPKLPEPRGTAMYSRSRKIRRWPEKPRRLAWQKSPI
jgi:branched-chain amino acid transport system substrate-binding protein